MHQHKHQQEHNSHHHESAPTNLTNTEGILLQQAWMSLAQNLRMQSISNFQHLGTSYIGQIVEIEMKRLKANCRREEELYVEQMLLENPIVVERRSSMSMPEQSTKAATDATPKTNDDDDDDDDGNNNGQQHSNGNGCSSISSNNGVRNDTATTLLLQQQQQQRTESCRRSRINNKIKKAKMKFRHKFMSSKLVQSLRMLECIQKLIDQTEMQLMSQGFTVQQLEKLKELVFCNGSL